MSNRPERITALLKAIDSEEKEEQHRYRIQDSQSLKSLRQSGFILQPIQVTRKYFGFADYPEFEFRLLHPADTGQFRDSTPIEIFYQNEEPIKAVLLSLQGQRGEVRLYAPDFPDWLEEKGIGIKRTADIRTNQFMRNALMQLEKNPELLTLFQFLHADQQRTDWQPHDDTSIQWQNQSLNASQQQAVRMILQSPRIGIVHGPPGTGKTTTLIEAIVQFKRQQKRVLVSAPSNAAVDHMTRGLAAAGLNPLRVGNSAKIADDILLYTPEGKLTDKSIQKELKALKHRADEFRRMALQYKRRFGKAEREQRNLLFQEVKSIRNEIKKTLQYYQERFLSESDVVLGTPLALSEQGFKSGQFDVLILDEAAQCAEPLAWGILPFAHYMVLAGDHFQLPPTVLSREAERLGLGKSLLEIAAQVVNEQVLLDTQYRMLSPIAGFASAYFYEGRLKTPTQNQGESNSIHFIDTAGTGFEEEAGAEGSSLMNTGELQLVNHLMDVEQLRASDVAFISPYAAQVALASNTLPQLARIATIDSFQGQEHHTIIISLVRSNEQASIGFLEDVRRMNVAMTRAKKKLFVIGDSATLAQHPFYKQYLQYVEQHGTYRSAWEFMT
ncbi:MAG: AAA family ATPase [Chitinophagaceae bacterium]|nr:AAA family ATPase [Chitinophagaceae bacterium]